MTPDVFVMDAAAAVLKVIMLGATGLLGFALLREISR